MAKKETRSRRSSSRPRPPLPHSSNCQDRRPITPSSIFIYPPNPNPSPTAPATVNSSQPSILLPPPAGPSAPHTPLHQATPSCLRTLHGSIRPVHEPSLSSSPGHVDFILRSLSSHGREPPIFSVCNNSDLGLRGKGTNATLISNIFLLSSHSQEAAEETIYIYDGSTSSHFRS